MTVDNCIILSLIICTTGYVCGHNFRTDHAFRDKMCKWGDVEFEIPTEYVLSCVRVCSKEQGCSGVIYSQDNMTCFGLNTDNPTLHQTRMPGFVYYKRIPNTATQQTAPRTSTSMPTQANMPSTSTTTETQTTTPPASTTTETQTTPPASTTTETQTTSPASTTTDTQTNPPASTTTETQTTPPASTTTETQTTHPASTTTETQTTPQTSTTTETQTTHPASTTTEAQTTPQASTTTANLLTTTTEACPRPLVAGVIDSQLTADFSISGFEPYHARLDDPGCWRTYPTTDHYIQVDFGSVVNITDVTTQGCSAQNHWVTTYRVLTSLDCSAYTEVHGGQSFVGNTDATTHVTNNFKEPITARCVRINPRSVCAVDSMAVHSIRFDVSGCPL